MTPTKAQELLSALRDNTLTTDQRAELYVAMEEELQAQLADHEQQVLDGLVARAGAQPSQVVEFTKLWLWKNFVDGRPEYWAFDNAFPVHMDHGDPQTVGEPCGFAIFKPSRTGRTDVSETEVLRCIAIANAKGDV